MAEDETAKVEKKKKRTTLKSVRVHDIHKLHTRRLETDDENPFEKIHTFLTHTGKLYESKSIDDLYRYGITAVRTLFHLHSYQILHYGFQKKLVPLDIELKEKPPEVSLDIEESYDDIVAWAFESQQVLFYDTKDAGSEEIASIGILPIASSQNHKVAIVLWLAESIDEMNVLQVDMLQILARDIASRSLALLQEQRQARLSSLFDNIMESVPHAIVAIAGDDRVIAINSNTEFLFGVKRIFVMDEPYKEVFSQEIAETFENFINHSLMGRELSDTEIEHRLSDGTPIHIGVSMNYLKDRNGQPQGYLFLCRDLSLSQEVLKLRELDKMKSEFVNTVSHELKTPLTAILGGLEIIESEPESIPEDMQEILDIVSGGAQRLRDLIFDLLDVARLESGRIELREQECHLKDIVQEALRVQTPGKNHTIKLEIDDALPAIMMDKAKILQCLTNYISNAIKYSPDGGQVTVKIDLEPESRSAVVGVSDQGVGLSPKHKDKVWQKFFRVDAGYTSEIEGTGLGLVIVKHIIELHGGRVWIDSELGKGSTFYFSLPLHRNENKDEH